MRESVFLKASLENEKSKKKPNKHKHYNAKVFSQFKRTKKSKSIKTKNCLTNKTNAHHGCLIDMDVVWHPQVFWHPITKRGGGGGVIEILLINCSSIMCSVDSAARETYVLHV